jgi:hypothetical protein
MSVIKNGLKKSFKIVLDSSKTANYTGLQFDANYMIDLTKILVCDEDYDKAYNMTFAFRSRSGAPATTNLNMNDVYSLCIDLGKGFNTLSANMNRNHVGIIPISNDFTAYTTTVCPSLFDAKDADNAPILIKNVRGLTSIRLTVVNNTTDAVFNSANDGTINTNTRYVCILTFTEI